MFPHVIAIVETLRLHPTHSGSVQRGFSSLKNLHTLLRTSLGEEKVDDLFFIRMNGPDETTGEADEAICLAVDRFSQIKSRQFD